MKTRYTCKECKMEFSEEKRLERHFAKAHPPKKEQYKQKWYWEN